MRLSRSVLLAVLVIGALIGAALTALGKVPRIAGWSAVFVAGAVALAGIFSTPLSEWLRTKTNIWTGRNEAVNSLLKTGAILARPIDRYDPVRDLGIHPAIEITEGPRIPVYVKRSIDIALDELMRHGGFIVLEGDSASGKSRTAYEAIRRNWSGLRLRSVIVPKDGPSLRTCVEAGYRFCRTVVWLDDLERFLQTDGLDEGIVHSLSNDADSVILLATIRSRAKAAFGISAARPDLHAFGFDARRVFAAASTFYLDKELDQTERYGAYALASDVRIAAALERGSDVGFAENIAAGPAIVEKWKSGKHGASAVGAALVSAAIDFQRAGYLGPIPRAWLEEVYETYVDRRLRAHLSPDEVQDGFAWATEAVRGASSCLEAWPDDKYSAFDFLVDHVQKEASHSLMAETETKDAPFESLQLIPEEIWHTLGDHVDINDPYFLSCVAASSFSLHPGMSYGLKQAIKNGDVDVSSLNTGQQLFALARACMEMHFCVACQISVLGLNLKALVSFLFEIIHPLLGLDSPRPIEDRQAEAIGITAFIVGDEEASWQPNSMLYETFKEFDPASLRRLGSLLNKTCGEGTATALLQFAEEMRDSPV